MSKARRTFCIVRYVVLRLFVLSIPPLIVSFSSLLLLTFCAVELELAMLQRSENVILIASCVFLIVSFLWMFIERRYVGIYRKLLIDCQQCKEGGVRVESRESRNQ